MIIDFSAHLISRTVSERIEGAYQRQGETRKYSYPAANADPEFRLAHMEKYGVDMQALSFPSITQPVALGFSNEEVARVCSDSNDANFALCKKHPKSFVNICIISLLDMNLAMKELDRVVNELDCRAVIVSSNQRGKGLDSTEYYPFGCYQGGSSDLPITDDLTKVLLFTTKGNNSTRENSGSHSLWILAGAQWCPDIASDALN